MDVSYVIAKQVIAYGVHVPLSLGYPNAYFSLRQHFYATSYMPLKIYVVIVKMDLDTNFTIYTNQKVSYVCSMSIMCVLLYASESRGLRCHILKLHTFD